MTAAVETMAYASTGGVPWHGLGNKVSNKLSPQEMLKAAGIDWTVSKADMFLGDGKKVPGKYALVRDTDNRVLSVVGKTYKPVQNADAMDFFRKFVAAGHMEMETAGSLMDGQYVWGLAKIGKNFKLGKNDEVDGYLLMASPHRIGKSLVYQFTGIRVVCWNTFTMALGASLKGKGHAFRMPHSVQFNEDVKKKAEEALGISQKQLDEFKEASELLTKKKAKSEQVTEYFFEVLELDRDDRKERAETGKKEPRNIERFQKALTFAPGQQLPTAAGTWWGAFNAVTYVVDHELGTSRGTGLRSAWLGGGARMKRRALDLAVKHAK